MKPAPCIEYYKQGYRTMMCKPARLAGAFQRTSRILVKKLMFAIFFFGNIASGSSNTFITTIISTAEDIIWLKWAEIPKNKTKKSFVGTRSVPDP